MCFFCPQTNNKWIKLYCKSDWFRILSLQQLLKEGSPHIYHCNTCRKIFDWGCSWETHWNCLSLSLPPQMKFSNMQNGLVMESTMSPVFTYVLDSNNNCKMEPVSMLNRGVSSCFTMCTLSHPSQCHECTLFVPFLFTIGCQHFVIC